ncbi:nucleotidyltransferase family protein [Solwaraspora sp. WMMB335]|uniref:nucleotidyltransferase family protein n=1 Tax=Solwaraspora sp. WMMB335 TaxID=3404118 RepID=UPI003B923DA2
MTIQLTADDVLSALSVCCGEALEDPAEAVALLRRSQPALTATLYSAWATSGVTLDPGLAYDLELATSRVSYFRRVAAELAEHATGLTPIKGLEVADRYPAGLGRSMNDLDYVARTEADLWQAARLLIDTGWELHTATFTCHEQRLHVMVSLRRPHESSFVLPYGVEIATWWSLGDLAGVPPLITMPQPWRIPTVKNTLMLLFERFEQPFRARDLVDASLLIGSATEAERSTLTQAMTALGLWPEYAELAALVEGTSLPTLPLPPRRHRLVTRARRATRGAAMLRRPLTGTARHLQRRLIRGAAARIEQRSWAAAADRIAVGPALRAGVLAFGLPLDGAPPGTAPTAILHERGRLAWADTPVGRFLLTVGDDVDADIVAELSNMAGPATAGVRP